MNIPYVIKTPENLTVQQLESLRAAVKEAEEHRVALVLPRGFDLQRFDEPHAIADGFLAVWSPAREVPQ